MQGEAWALLKYGAVKQEKRANIPYTDTSNAKQQENEFYQVYHVKNP